MKEYLLSMAGAVLLSGIITAILPEGKTAKLIKSIAKLCCLLVILAPIPAFVSWAKGDGENSDKINFPFFSEKTVIETDGTFIDYCSRERVENARQLLEKELQEKYSANISVQLVWKIKEGSDEICIEKTIVTAAEGAETMDEEVKENMSEYILQKYGCEAEFVWA